MIPARHGTTVRSTRGVFLLIPFPLCIITRGESLAVFARAADASEFAVHFAVKTQQSPRKSLTANHDWALLIYSLPSQPSRKRAYVWRELKRLGAVYLRDGVALLPRRPAVETHLRQMVDRITEYEGTADLIPSPQFAAAREPELVAQFQEERAREYREVYHACVRFLRDVLHEVDADDFGFPDVGNLESELGRLHRWYAQILERDYFQASGSDRVSEMLLKCDTAFDRFSDEAVDRSTSADEAQPDDVFERLGGALRPDESVPEDFPL
jgi:hypothetical protein